MHRFFNVFLVICKVVLSHFIVQFLVRGWNKASLRWLFVVILGLVHQFVIEHREHSFMSFLDLFDSIYDYRFKLRHHRIWSLRFQQLTLLLMWRATMYCGAVSVWFIRNSFIFLRLWMVRYNSFNGYLYFILSLFL